ARSSGPFTEERIMAQRTTDSRRRAGELLVIATGLLAAAQEDIQALRLTSPTGNNAVEKYHDVLQLEPLNQQARSGLRQVADKYLELMDGALNKHELPKARNYLAKAAYVDPAHPGLVEAQRRLQAAVDRQTDTDIKTDEAPAVVDKNMETDNVPGLMSENERRTLERIKERLQKNPDDRIAQRQAKRIARNFERKVKSALEDGQYELAENYVLEALEIAPDNKGLKEALNKIREVRIKTGQ
ncbi:MAG: hypothetical protein R3318_03495, partial [Gammaproteobacteria bacterium]|nr:hypothetical protein [Gammaproteobacteria bacterium]